MTLRAPLTGLAWSLTLVAAWWTAATFAAVAGAEPTDLPRLLTTDPSRAAAALLAGASHLLVAYLALVTAASALAALSGRESAVRRVRALAIPALRPVLDAGAGWALALGAATLPLAPTVAPALVVGQDPEPAPPPSPAPTIPDGSDDGSDDGSPVTMRRLPDVESSQDAPSEVLRRLPDLDAPVDPATGPPATEPPTTAAPVTTATTDPSAPAEPADPPTSSDPAPTPPGSGPVPPDGPAGEPDDAAGSGEHGTGTTDPTPSPTGAAPSAPETWTIEPGDHLWHVAEATLAEHDGADPSPGRILAYLDALVDANRDTLVEPGNADLVLPGQVFVLPAVPAS